jgi:hypothetical protein
MGARAVGLVKDGQVIVDPKVDNNGKSPWLIVGGIVAALAAAWASWRRIRDLRNLASPARQRAVAEP